MMKKFQPLSVFILLILFTSCKEKCPYEPISLGGTVVNLDIKDLRSGEYLLKDQKPLFDKSLIRVTDENGSIIPFKFVLVRKTDIPLYSYYRLVIPEIYKTGDSMELRVCKRYLILFDKQSGQLDVCFKVFNSECSQYFSQIDLKFDGKAIASKENTTYITAEISR